MRSEVAGVGKMALRHLAMNKIHSDAGDKAIRDPARCVVGFRNYGAGRLALATISGCLSGALRNPG